MSPPSERLPLDGGPGSRASDGPAGPRARRGARRSPFPAPSGRHQQHRRDPPTVSRLDHEPRARRRQPDRSDEWGRRPLIERSRGPARSRSRAGPIIRSMTPAPLQPGLRRSLRGSCPYSSVRPAPPMSAKPRWSSSVARRASAGPGSSPSWQITFEPATGSCSRGGLSPSVTTGFPSARSSRRFALVHDVDPARIADAAGPGLPELTRLVPELSSVGSEAPCRPATPTGCRSVSSRASCVLGHFGRDHPVLLIVEETSTGRTARLTVLLTLPDPQCP